MTDSVAAWHSIGVEDKHLGVPQDPSRRMSENKVDYLGWKGRSPSFRLGEAVEQYEIGVMSCPAFRHRRCVVIFAADGGGCLRAGAGLCKGEHSGPPTFQRREQSGEH